MKHNTFRAADAFEFVDAVRSCNFSRSEAETRARELSDRMATLESSGKEIPSYLLAAYRGYEFVIAGPFSEVTLDQSMEAFHGC